MNHLVTCGLAALLFTPLLAFADEAGSAIEGSGEKGSGMHDWAASVKLPAGETGVRLYNGKDFTGWQERRDDFFSPDGDAIRAANGGQRIAKSTYLFTEKKYRNLRLLLEIKQTVDKKHHWIHSGVALLGAVAPNDANDPFGFRGPLVLLCNEWGLYGSDGRGHIYPKPEEKRLRTPPFEQVGEWNQIEILAVGNHLRFVANGSLVLDYTEEDPKRMRPSPIGLQLHSSSYFEEYRFRGLLLVENPRDELLTVKK